MTQPGVPTLEFICSDWCQLYFMRGYVDPQILVDAIKADENPKAEKFSAPVHTYLRGRPHPDFTRWYDEVEGGGRGAFKVTMARAARKESRECRP